MIIRKNFKHLKIHVLLAALAVATATATATATHLKIQLCYLIQPFELLNTNHSYFWTFSSLFQRFFFLITWNLFIGQFVVTAINHFLPVRLLDPRKFCGPTFCVATGFVFLDFCIGRGHICVQVPCVRLVCVDLTWPVQKLYTN